MVVLDDIDVEVTEVEVPGPFFVKFSKIFLVLAFDGIKDDGPPDIGKLDKPKFGPKF